MAGGNEKSGELMRQFIKEMDLLTNVIYCFFKGYARKTACISQGRLTAIYKNPKGWFLVHFPVFRRLGGEGGACGSEVPGGHCCYGHSETTDPSIYSLPTFQGLRVPNWTFWAQLAANEGKRLGKNLEVVYITFADRLLATANHRQARTCSLAMDH